MEREPTTQSSVIGVHLTAAARDRLAQAQRLIHSYTAARQELKGLGVLRSERNLQGDYAEWLAAELLGLRLAASGVQKGYDATDDDGRRYQIKARIVPDLRQHSSFNFREFDPTRKSFDVFLGVFLSPTLDLLGLIRVSWEAVRDIGVGPTHDFRFRWHGVVASDSRVEKLIWLD
ncbi:MAG TPA: hypothetical protein VLJ14_06775, partial [Ktedonobacterales bacterium]|nr:hypothetical protein [Ktedonobacterales bacterium]